MKFELHPFRNMLKEGIECDSNDNRKHMLDFDYIRELIEYLKRYTDEYEAMFCYSDEEKETAA